MSARRHTALIAAVVGALLLALAPTAQATSPGPAADSPGYHLVLVATGFQRPVYVATSGALNKLYVVEQRGRIKVLKRDSPADPWVKAGAFLDLRSQVEGPYYSLGMLGLAFHPRYKRNGLFYVFYTRKDADPSLNGDIVIAEFHKRTGLRARVGSKRIVLDVDLPSVYHPGGWIGFGPDGYLYVTTGDAGNSAAGYSQDTGSRLGKVLRFNPRKAVGDDGFVPADNPFVGVDGADLVWAYGLRNPWRASFDAHTGALWLSDPGQSSWEEVNRLASGGAGGGANLAWPACEGSHAYPVPAEGSAPCALSGATQPTIEYAHAEGRCSVIGGHVYRGSAQPSLSGRYFFADYCSGEIWAVTAGYEAGEDLPAPLDTDLLITSFGQGPGGELYVTALDGSLWLIVQD